MSCVTFFVVDGGLQVSVAEDGGRARRANQRAADDAGPTCRLDWWPSEERRLPRAGATELHFFIFAAPARERAAHNAFSCSLRRALPALAMRVPAARAADVSPMPPAARAMRPCS
jgi:hypothetical protein